MTSVQTHTVIQRRLPRLLLLVSGIRDPAVALQQDRGAEVLLAVPPVGWAGGGAARAQDAFVETVELLAVLGRLEVFLAVFGGGGAL
jgi:hypothetical protein